MANTILHKRKSGASGAPVAGDLSLGELAINTADGKLYTKKDDLSVVEIGAGGSSTFTLTASETLYAGTGAGAALTAGATDNFIAGNNAGAALVSGDHNVLIGAEAGQDLTGSNNIMLGQSAGLNATTGTYNVLIGDNVVPGATALTGGGNVCLGGFTGFAMEGSAQQNTFIGGSAGQGNTTGFRNTILGNNAGLHLSTGSENVIIGYGAGPQSGGGDETASGRLWINNVASDTPLIAGDFIGDSVTINGSLTVTGTLAGEIFTEDSLNFWGGSNSGTTLAAGADRNVLVGPVSGRYISTGDDNTVMGYQAGSNISTGSRNTAIGSSALIGSFGAQTTGSDNTAVGDEAGLGLNSTAAQNTLIGSSAGRNLTTGLSNTVVGYQALNNASVSTAGTMTAIGHSCAAKVTGGSGSVFIGHDAGPTTTGTSSSELYIDNTETDTPLVYGDFANDAITINGDLEVTQHLYHDAVVANTTAVAIDWTDGNIQTAAPTAAGNPTYTFTAPDGPARLTFIGTNLGAAGSITWPATVKWPGGTEPTWTSSGVDKIEFVFDGTDYLGTADLAFA